MFTRTRSTAQRRSQSLALPWLPAVALAIAFTSLAAAQDYGQYPDPNAQQGPYAQPGTDAQQDPPSRVARLSLTQGTVSLQPATVPDFSPAEVNYPLTGGDRLWVDTGSLAELQFGQAAVRLGQATDLTVTGLTDTLAQFGMAQGSVHLRTFALDPGTTTELDTPNAAVTVLAPGDVRVDVYPNDNITVVTLLAGAAQVDSQGFSQQLRPGESLQLAGANPVNAQGVRRNRPDGLDGFSANLDNMYLAAVSSEGAYVSGGTIGAADLGNYGDWSSDPDNGAVWFPRGVAADWQPYRYGHWAYVAPWGWTWVESEPWGFAPFHYGRWGQFGGRWGWIPGPPTVRPVYSPALVVFVGGGNAGVTAWFPLGPREPFQPWYHTSDRYLTRVNVTNIYNRDTVEVRNVYGNAGRGPSPFRADPNRAYVNRPVATIAVRQDIFAGGRPVAGASLRVSPGQFDHAPLLAHPMAAPTRAIMAPGPARALPPQINRPELQNRAGGAPGQGGPGSRDAGFGNRGGGSGNPAPASGTAAPSPGRNQQAPGNGSVSPRAPYAPTHEPPTQVNSGTPIPTPQPSQTTQRPTTNPANSPAQPQPGPIDRAGPARGTYVPGQANQQPYQQPSQQRYQQPGQQPYQQPSQQPSRGQAPSAPAQPAAPVQGRQTPAVTTPQGQPGPIDRSGPRRGMFQPDAPSRQPATAAPAQQPTLQRSAPNQQPAQQRSAPAQQPAAQQAAPRQQPAQPAQQPNKPAAAPKPRDGQRPAPPQAQPQANR